MVIPPERLAAIRARLARLLQQAAALAFELNDVIASRRLYEDARRYEDQPAPGADMQLFEHPDERMQ